ncbi:MAG: CHASE4 domain-containing protein, partial [Spirochaetota bacterium]
MVRKGIAAPREKTSRHRTREPLPAGNFAQIRRRSVTLLVVVFVIASVASMAFLHPYIYSTFLGLEGDEAKKQWQRAAKGLDRESTSLVTFARDWATWDDMYAFVRSRDPVFVASSLADTSFDNYHLAFLAIFNENSALVWGEGWDRLAHRTAPLMDYFPDFLARFDHLRRLTRHPEGMSDLVQTLRDLVTVAALPILRS